jgi:hypothetical protein
VSRPILLKDRYRSKLEEKVADQLTAEGIPFSFESEWVPYDVPARRSKYLPDFIPTKQSGDRRILIEAKGRFGGHLSDSNGAKERQKLILIKEQHPELDIRIVFQDARKPIYKGSKTTYAKWAADHGFTWADRGVVPAAWINELRG